MSTRSRGSHSPQPRPRVWGDAISECSSTQLYPLGTIREHYENLYVYCKAGATALTAGLINSTPAITATEVEDAVTVAHPAGTYDVTITAGGTYTENQFRDGYLWVDSGTAIGECYRIAGHPAIASGATGTITLCDPLKTAWSTSDTDISMLASPYRNIIVVATATVGEEHAVCVNQWGVTANYYFWGLKDGFGALQIDVNGQTVGEDKDDKMIVPSPNHAGFGYVATPAADAVRPLGEQIIGYTVGGLDYTDNKAYLCHIML